MCQRFHFSYTSGSRPGDPGDAKRPRTGPPDGDATLRDPQLSLAQQLEAYEHVGGWVNRMILGDSLIVMNSLLEYEGLGGQVQMIYVDPPYGVKFGSNFQHSFASAT